MSRRLAWSEDWYARYLMEQRRATLDTSEKVLQQAQRKLALEHGYLYYHTYSSKRSDPGFPDTAIVHPEGGTTLHLWENKRVGERPSQAQQRWLDALANVTRVQVAVYTPEDWPTIRALLTGSVL